MPRLMSAIRTGIRVRRWCLGLVTGAVLGCQADPTPPPSPVALNVATQPSSAATSGLPFQRQPVVELLDRTGKPLAFRAIQVTTALVSGSGGLVGAVSVRTDDQGRAVFVDLGVLGLAGSYVLQFSAAGLASASSQAIGLVAGTATAMEIVAGNSQVAPAGTDLPIAPTVRLHDNAGNPVSGLLVTFTVAEGGGTVQGPTPITDGDGRAAVTGWKIGRGVGSNALVASVGGLSSRFSAIGTLGPAAKMSLVTGAGQTGGLGSPLPIAPTVKVTDSFDNPLPGLQVNFSADNGGQVAAGNPQTDALGVASPTSWVLGLVRGTQALTARVGGVAPLALSASAIDFPVTVIEAGALGACGIAAGGAAFCWGSNATGRIGDGTLIDRTLPTPVLGGLAFKTISVGTGHACAVSQSGVGYCWGANSAGQLGDSSVAAASDPRPVAGGHVWTSIVAGDAHSCGLVSGGGAWCWGLNANGRLGDSTTASRIVPVAVSGGHSFDAVTVGLAHTCGLRSDKQVLCWGAGANGRLGLGTTADQRVPAVVNVAGASFVAVSAGGSHTCAVTVVGAAMCWGSGANGVLGDGGTAQRLIPGATAGNEVFRTVSAGLSHTCAVSQADRLFCWGMNGSGRLGDGTFVNRLVPTPIAVGSAFSDVSTGADHTCARMTAASAVCWGNGQAGQLGDGTTTAAQLRPVGVARPPVP